MPGRPNKEGQMEEGGQKWAAQCCWQKGRGEREGLMIRRQINIPALRASVFMEVIPGDQIFFPLHIY